MARDPQTAIRILVVTSLCLAVTACATSVPTDTPGVRAYGDETMVYDGPELSASVNTRQARRLLGEEYLMIEVEFGGRSTSKIFSLDRSAISIQAPDRRRFPLMTQPEFLESYGEVAAAAMRVEFQPVGPPDTRRMEAPCVDWFFRRPADGLARDRLSVSPFQTCWGPLFFHVPGGVQPGRWELHIQLEESKAEIPFTLESD